MRISRAFVAKTISSPNAKSSKTFTEGPPFICDNSSNAKSIDISSTDILLLIISFKNLSLGLISLKKSKTESYNVEELNDFKKVLDNIIEEIFDQSISFSENQP